MGRILVLVVVICAASLAHADKRIVDNKGITSHDCAKDPSLAIVGNDNWVTVTGDCANVVIAGNNNTLKIAGARKLSVPGTSNTISVERVDAIVTPGTKNAVTWKQGFTAKAPTTSDTGTANKVAAAKP